MQIVPAINPALIQIHDMDIHARAICSHHSH
jgi:hypothetical protein